MSLVHPHGGAAQLRTYSTQTYLSFDPGGVLRVTGPVGSVGVGSVVVEPSAGLFSKKHLGTVTFEPIVVNVAPGDGPIDKWLAAVLHGRGERRNGSILTVDYNLKVVNQLNFSNAAIIEATFPTIDAASKEPGYIKVKLAPEFTRRVAPDAPSPAATASSKWLASTVRVKMDGLPTRVVRIDSLGCRHALTSSSVGESRDYEKQPGKLEFPNILVTLPDADMKDWYAWYDDFVVQGRNADEQEKNFTVELLNATLDRAILTIRAYNAGIVAIRPVAGPADGIQRSQVELYVERLEFVAP